MPHKTTLKLLQNILKELWIPSHLLTEPFVWDDSYDMNLRKTVLKDSSQKQNFFSALPSYKEEKTVYEITDAFRCEYLYLRLPESLTAQGLLIGPYTRDEFTYVQYSSLCERLNIPKNLRDFIHQYYSSLASIPDRRFLKALLQGVGLMLWGEGTVLHWKEELADAPNGAEYIPQLPELTSEGLQIINQRYLKESRILNLITQGNSVELNQCLDEPFPPLAKRLPDNMRDRKNYLIIMNTLGRKAAEFGGVPPLYLDELSNRFSLRIESETNPQVLEKMWRDIPRKYCFLVRSHSISKYTQPVQRAIDYIFAHLTDDLSLKKISDEIHLNSSYLSSLFRKETGQTMTTYIHAIRIERALYLLNTTSLPVVEIAHKCGIPDANYFTKTFKRLKGMTPSEYRQMLKK